MRTVELGDICEFVYGRNLPASQRREGEYPVYGSNGCVGFHNEPLSHSSAIIVGRKGSIGQINFSERPCWPIDTTYYIDKNSTSEDIRWLYYALKSLRLSDLNRATGVPGLNRNDAYQKKFAVPPIDEQRRIAAILDKADSIHGKRAEILNQVDYFRSSVFFEIFGDPASNPNRYAVRDFGSLLIVPLRNGVSPSAKGNVDASVLTLSAITGNGFDPCQKKEGRFIEPISEKDQISEADFYICRGNGSQELVGKGYFATQTMEGVAFPDTMIAARPDPELVTPGFLETIWNSHFVRAQIINSARTTNGTYKINQTATENIEFPVPPIELQYYYGKLCDKISVVKQKLAADVFGDRRLFDSLFQRAFRGEL